MKKSALVKRIEEYALEHIMNDWGNEQDNYISVEYILVAMMKYAEPETFKKEDYEKLKQSSRDELDELRRGLNKIEFTLTRQGIKDRLVKPDKEAERFREWIETVAIERAEKAGSAILTARFYYEAIVIYPSDFIEEILYVPSSKSNLRKLIALSDEKRSLKAQLSSKVIGQSEAINAFVDGIISSKFLNENTTNTKPKGVFVFAGPPGVGKTFLAETGAQELELCIKRFDMSEYTERQDSVVKLIGVTKSWKNSAEGDLTSFVSLCNKRKKDCFLIFDEIEKAHMEVIQLFLQILDAGRLTDRYTGEVVSFGNTYIVFTTNAGRSLYENGKQPPKGIEKSLVIDALRNDINPITRQRFFPEAILSRFESGYTVMFRHLSASDLVTIGLKEMKRCGAAFEQTYGIEVAFDEEIPFLLLLKQGGECDARIFKSESQKFVYNQLFTLGDSLNEDLIDSGVCRSNRIRFMVNPQNRDELRNLLATDNDSKSVMLISKDNEQLGDMECALTESSDLFIDEYQLVPLESYREAKKAIKRGLIFPSVLIVDMPRNENESVVFNKNAPLRATSFAKFLDFLEFIMEEMPETLVYVTLCENNYEGEHIVSDLLEKGVTNVIKYSEVNEDFVEEVCNCLQHDMEISQLRSVAHKFARERKGLNYTVSPNRANGEIVIRLSNFNIITLVSSSDDKGLVTDDRMPSVTFDDYIGGENIKSEMREFISFLQNPRKYKANGGEQPKGILLYGPPGTGKTFFAKALAHEAGVPFFAANGASFINQYKGSGSEAVRKLFATARKYAPAIVFIDEIDAFAKKRTGNENQFSEEETLNMLLSELDGFEEDVKRPIFLIAATNYGIDQNSNMSLDAALVRRFTRTIYVDLPNEQERKDYFILRLKAYNCTLSEAFLGSVAKRSVGMNYGNIKNVVDKVVRDAKKYGTPITEELLNEALETIQFGEKKEWGIETLERIAWHEAGHAYVNWKCGQTPEYITITARGNLGGYVMPAQDEEKFVWTKKDILNQVRACLAGRMAEVVRYGQEEGVSTGPSQDIEQAGKLLMKYVCVYGMDEKMGMVFVQDYNNPPAEVLHRVHELLTELSSNVLEELERDKSRMQLFVEQLLMRNKLTSYEIDEILKEVK